MGCGFRPHDRDRTTESMRGLDGLVGCFGGVLGCNERGAFVVAWITVGASNDLQMERNWTGGLPVMYQGQSTNLGPFQEHFSPTHKMRSERCNGCMCECRTPKWTTRKMTRCKRRTRMQMRCT